MYEVSLYASVLNTQLVRGTNWHSLTLVVGVYYLVYYCMCIYHIHRLGFGYYCCTNSWLEHVSCNINTNTIVIEVAFYRFYLFRSANTVDCYRLSLFISKVERKYIGTSFNQDDIAKVYMKS
jgi:hypothetical protein